MSSIGPLGHPPIAPVVNPVMWAPELPVNRPQMHPEPAAAPVAAGPRVHMVGTVPLTTEEVVPADRVVVTPVDIEERAAEAHAMTFHPTSELAGARLDPSDPSAPFGATVKDAQGEPITTRDGPEVDPYAVAGAGEGAGGDDAAADELSALGDGSLAAAQAAIEAIRQGEGST